MEELRKDGFRVINLQRKSPDVIAVKDEKIYAVEILPKKLRQVGNFTPGAKVKYKWKHQGGYTFAMKERTYSMFDDVIFFTYEKESEASKEKNIIVNKKLKRKEKHVNG